ncbi:hypothetical protein AX768_31735 (plasmid) [Burkholderia sp. PAMC 28687]|uniref:hypothetical protein n=1 Tax=Burkholderia sp. PAMC 28687 TaxID=1795874 RepID=UPI00078086B5|nr:hypothetical protein [Burkholderia sp. PAMC 28687]AMM18813.1 hypothetical protein AX768_31735 [Burkholderia sp. PAMC 28687]
MEQTETASEANPYFLDRSIALDLELVRAVQLSITNDSKDPNALLRLLDLDFATFEPMQRHLQPKRWLWMAAQTSSGNYRGALTEETLLSILTSGNVPDDFVVHIGHFLDEAPIQWVVMAVVEAAQRNGMSIRNVWGNVTVLALRYSHYRRGLWT